MDTVTEAKMAIAIAREGGICLLYTSKAEVSAKDKVDYYSIEVSEEMIDNQVKMYTQRTGKDVYKRQLFVRIAANGTFTTLYVVLVAITEVSSLLRKKQLYN